MTVRLGLVSSLEVALFIGRLLSAHWALKLTFSESASDCVSG